MVTLSLLHGTTSLHCPAPCPGPCPLSTMSLHCPGTCVSVRYITCIFSLPLPRLNLFHIIGAAAGA